MNMQLHDDDAVRDFFFLFTEKDTSRTLPGIVRIKDEYYAQSKEMEEMVENLPEREVSAPGSYLGRVQKGKFVPGTTVLDLLSAMTDRKVFLEQKQAWLFLCGRDLFSDNVRKANVKEGYVLVQTMDDENLGYGIYRKEGRRMLIKNLFDRGDFLRREKHAH